VISGDSASDSDGDVRPFIISGGPVTLSGLTIQDGLVTGRDHGGGSGGEHGFTIRSSTIAANLAAMGGGIAMAWLSMDDHGASPCQRMH
jgi:hypothetical protein